MTPKKGIRFLQITLSACSLMALMSGHASAGLKDVFWDAVSATKAGISQQVKISTTNAWGLLEGVGKVAAGACTLDAARASSGMMQCGSSILTGTRQTLANINVNYTGFADDHKTTDLLMKMGVVAGAGYWLGLGAGFWMAKEALIDKHNASTLLLHGTPMRLFGGALGKSAGYVLESSPQIVEGYRALNRVAFNFLGDQATAVTGPIIQSTGSLIRAARHFINNWASWMNTSPSADDVVRVTGSLMESSGGAADIIGESGFAETIGRGLAKIAIPISFPGAKLFDTVTHVKKTFSDGVYWMMDPAALPPLQ